MCEVCAAFQSGGSCGFAVPAPLVGRLAAPAYEIPAYEIPASEIAAYEIPGNATSTETIAVGAERRDRLGFPGDEDWYRLSLGAGQSVAIELTGAGTDPLSDPYLWLYDAAGTLVAQDDDSGPGLGARIEVTARSAGTFLVAADSYGGNYAGDYRLTVAETAPSRPVDSVRGVTRLDTSDPVLVYLAAAGDTYRMGSTSYTATGFNAYEAAQLWSVLEAVEAFAGIDFRPTAHRAAADLEWGGANLGSSLLGFFYLPTSAGTGGHGLLNDSFSGWGDAPGGGLDAGGFMYGVAIHELGHGLGLGHTHDTGNGTVRMSGVADPTSLGAFGLNQTVHTAMSYNDGWQTNPDGRPGTYQYGYGRTFGAIDIAALQQMYGANTTAAAGDDVYLLTDANAPGAGYRTIWDTAGRDALRYTGTRDAVLDLRAATLAYEPGGGGFISRAAGIFAGITIAAGVVIENATGGSGNDRLVGNDAANTLVGGAGADTLDGGAGNDVLEGGTGDDLLTGGAGADIFRFAAGHGSDRILDFRPGTDLLDLVLTGAGYADLALSDGTAGALLSYSGGGASAGRIELAGIRAAQLSARDFLSAAGRTPTDTEDADMLVGTASADTLHGLGGADTLRGEQGADVLFGDAGDDLLFGGAGTDRLYGGAGDDWLDVGAGDPSGALQFAAGQDGDDTYVYARASGRLLVGAASEDATSGTADRVVFTDLSLADLALGIYDYRPTAYAAEGRALRFQWSDGGVSGELRVALEGRHIERFEFADGRHVAAVTVADDAGGTTVGTAANDALFGGAGTDRLYGGAGDDWLDVGAGDPSGALQFAAGQDGDDTYVYARASGRLLVGAASEDATSGTADRVVFTDLSLADLALGIYDYRPTAYAAEGRALRFQWSDGGASGELRVALEGRHIERFEFADGRHVATVAVADAAGGASFGTAGNDALFGGAGTDRLYGGAGDDWLDVGAGDPSGALQLAAGQGGDDTYVYARASGRVLVGAASEDATSGTADRIVFTDLSLADLALGIYDYRPTAYAAEGRALRFQWSDGGQAGELRVAQEGRHIERFEFADGAVMTPEELAPLFDII